MDKVQGHRDNTRAQDVIHLAVERCKKLAKTYNHNFSKLKALAGPDSCSPTSNTDGQTTATKGKGKGKAVARVETCCGLRSVDLNIDLKVKDVHKARSGGDGKYEASWIWTTPVPPGATDEDVAAWSVEGELVHFIVVVFYIMIFILLR